MKQDSWRAKTGYVELCDQLSRLDKEGYCLLAGVFSETEVANIKSQIEAALAELALATDLLSKPPHSAVYHRQGGVYAARSLLQIAPFVQGCWQKSSLTELLNVVLGTNAGLVRALYFDKPPGMTWALPWHKDMKIAIADDCEPDETYSPPRLRDGILHTEAPLEVLNRMLTLRIHLDANTAENGPLEVLPGGHLTGKVLRIDEFRPVRILSDAGDVLAMRPLLPHASGSSSPGTTQNRRILHLEFAADQTLPGGAVWHDFLPVNDSRHC